MTVLQPICTQYTELVRTSCTVRQNSTYSAFQYVTYSAAVTLHSKKIGPFSLERVEITLKVFINGSFLK